MKATFQCDRRIHSNHLICIVRRVFSLLSFFFFLSRALLLSLRSVVVAEYFVDGSDLHVVKRNEEQRKNYYTLETKQSLIFFYEYNSSCKCKRTQSFHINADALSVNTANKKNID